MQVIEMLTDEGVAVLIALALRELVGWLRDLRARTRAETKALEGKDAD